jgi:hypothetical protein
MKIKIRWRKTRLSTDDLGLANSVMAHIKNVTKQEKILEGMRSIAKGMREVLTDMEKLADDLKNVSKEKADSVGDKLTKMAEENIGKVKVVPVTLSKKGVELHEAMNPEEVTDLPMALSKTEPTEEETLTTVKHATHGTKRTSKNWTIDEDKYIVKHLHLDPRELATHDFLLKRHTTNAIRCRQSVIKCRNFKKLGRGRGRVLKKHMDRGYNVRRKKKAPDFWGKEEERYLLDNSHEPISTLMKALPGRTRSAITSKRNSMKKKQAKETANGRARVSKLLKKRDETKGHRPWNQLEKNFVVDNLNKSPKWLAKQDILKGRSLNAIGVMKCNLKREQKKLAGTG